MKKQDEFLSSLPLDQNGLDKVNNYINQELKEKDKEIERLQDVIIKRNDKEKR